ncbi:MAG: (Fe-S)-binding protein [Betaproteobacteria bacterium]|nr:(Fe-S)-binding protein [Betaproteobacteria bacterium]
MSLETRKRYIERCPRCSQCKWLPAPKSQRFASVCPSIQYGNFHSYSAGGKGFTAYAMLENRIGYSAEMLRSVFACTMCGACDTSCKTNFGDNIEPLDTLYELRARVVRDGKSLPAHVELIDNLRRVGNPFGKPSQERARWAEGLNLKDITKQRADVFLHIGCTPAYDEAEWRSLQFCAELLKNAKVDFGVAGNAEQSSGGLAFDLGFQEDARRLAEASAKLVVASGAKTLVTCCAESYAAFKNGFPRLGVSLGGLRVLHITEYLDELIRDGRLKPRSSANALVTYHDPCKLGRLSETYTPWQGEWRRVLNVMYIAVPPRPVLYGTEGNYDAPRRLLQSIAGVEVVEMERSREYSYCCGAGGGAKEAYPDFAEKTAGDRLTEAEATGASVMVTACATCQRHLSAVANKQGSKLRVKGLLEMLCEAVV